MERVKEIIAFLFKRAGKEELTGQELRLALSMDLRWFTPKEADQLVDLFQNKRLVVHGEKDGLRPSFNYRKLTLPRDFKPSPDMLFNTSGEEPVFIQMVGHIADRGDMEKRRVIAAINRRAQELGIEVEAAAMLVGSEVGVDMRPFGDDALKAIEEKANNGR